MQYAAVQFYAVGPSAPSCFRAQWLACVLSYRRFAVTLASANARLGADAVRYSFTVMDFYILLFAGFDRRTVIAVLPLRSLRRQAIGAPTHRMEVLTLSRR